MKNNDRVVQKVYPVKLEKKPNKTETDFSKKCYIDLI